MLSGTDGGSFLEKHRNVKGENGEQNPENTGGDEVNKRMVGASTRGCSEPSENLKNLSHLLGIRKFRRCKQRAVNNRPPNLQRTPIVKLLV